jgi:hypothetical protein
VSTLDSLYAFANLRLDQGKLAEAEIMYAQARHGFENAVGLKHIWTLNTITSLGLLYVYQSKLAEVDLLPTRALHDIEEASELKLASELDKSNTQDSLCEKQVKSETWNNLGVLLH